MQSVSSLKCIIMFIYSHLYITGRGYFIGNYYLCMSGTFDVQNLLVSECLDGGGICVSIEYVEGTHSPGALVCAVRIMKNGALDFANMKLVTIPRNSSDNFPIPVPSGEYRLIAFDLEDTHLPIMPNSTVALNMTVNSDGEGTRSVCFSN